jgi:PPOX class probable F420-dependent enzyme
VKQLGHEMLCRVLDAMPIARLALRDFDDNPEVLPIVFARAADALWMPIDGKRKRSGAGLGRLARLERSPKVMLMIDHYADAWSDLWWIRLRCEATIIAGKHPDWDAAVAALADKYRQYDEIAMFQDEPLLVRYAWSGVSWWSATPGALLRWIDEYAKPPAG